MTFTRAMAKGNINLLPQEEFEASTLGRILRWAMGSFRIIVIMTEMVVMAAFLSRFWLDAQNSDLNDQIKIKTAEISAQKDLETQFRSIQIKLDIFKKIQGIAQASGTLDTIASAVPQEVSFNSLNISQNSSEIRGTSTSESGIAQFLTNLKANKTFKDVELETVNSSQDNPSNSDFAIKITF